MGVANGADDRNNNGSKHTQKSKTRPSSRIGVRRRLFSTDAGHNLASSKTGQREGGGKEEKRQKKNIQPKVQPKQAQRATRHPYLVYKHEVHSQSNTSAQKNTGCWAIRACASSQGEKASVLD